jgi:hypothetical protein
MALPKYVVGASSIAVGLLLRRMAIRAAHPAPGMTPQELWQAMPAMPKVMIIAAVVLLGFGSWRLIKAGLDGLAGRKRNVDPARAADATAWSRFENEHPAAWTAVAVAGFLLALLMGLARAIAELGAWPATPEESGYLVGAIAGPLIMAGVGAGVYYAVRKSRRNKRRFISAWSGWALLLALVSIGGTAGHSPRFPKDNQEIVRMANQAYKEASGAVPPDQYSKDELATAMRDMFRDLVQFNQQYRDATAQFHTPEMKGLYGASSFGSRQRIEETVRQLRNMAGVESQFASLDSVFAKSEARIQQEDWTEHSKKDFIQGMEQSLAQTKQSRLAVYQVEQKWLDASLDLYTFALNNRNTMSVRQNHVVIGNHETFEAFNERLDRAVELHKEVLESSRQYDRERASQVKKYGLSPADLGLKQGN